MGTVSCCEAGTLSKNCGYTTKTDGSQLRKEGLLSESVSTVIPQCKLAALACQPVVDYPNGSKYQGETNDADQRHGFGRVVLADGSELLGDWQANKVKGLARLVLADGDLIEGTWSDSLVVKGKGKFLSAEGVHWDGFAHEGQAREVGVDFSADGPVYVGQFLGGERDGQGCLLLPDGSSYKVYHAH